MTAAANKKKPDSDDENSEESSSGDEEPQKNMIKPEEKAASKPNSKAEEEESSDSEESSDEALSKPQSVKKKASSSDEKSEVDNKDSSQEDDQPAKTTKKSRGRSAGAEAEFGKLLGGLHVKSSMVELSKSNRGDEVDSLKLSELLYGRHFRVVFIGSALLALQQLSGINAVFYFSSTVFKSAGVPSDIANMFVGVVNLSVVAMVLMDKLGRKGLLLGSFMGMALSMTMQAVAGSTLVSEPSVVYLSVGGVLLFVLSFAMGVGPVPGLLLSEIFPSRIRAKAMAICMAVHWVINFFVGLLFLRLLEQLGPQILYTVFASFCLLGFFFVRNNVVETKGKTLQEIEMALLPV